MANTVQLKKDGQIVYPITDVSLIIGLQDAIKLPPIKTTTLPTASAETAGKMYYVGPDANDEYERYITSAVNGSYEWIDLGGTEIPLPSIADNLTTDDANTALSAKQGKVLNEEIEGLEAKLYISEDNYVEMAYSMNSSTGKFGTDATYKHISVQVNEGERYSVTAPSSQNCSYAFVTTDAFTSGGDIPLVSGTSVTVVLANTTAQITIPSGCSYLLVYNFSNARPWGVAIFVSDKAISLEDEIESIEPEVKGFHFTGDYNVSGYSSTVYGPEILMKAGKTYFLKVRVNSAQSTSPLSVGVKLNGVSQWITGISEFPNGYTIAKFTPDNDTTLSMYISTGNVANVTYTVDSYSDIEDSILIDEIKKSANSTSSNTFDISEDPIGTKYKICVDKITDNAYNILYLKGTRNGSYYFPKSGDIFYFEKSAYVTAISISTYLANVQTVIQARLYRIKTYPDIQPDFPAMVINYSPSVGNLSQGYISSDNPEENENSSSWVTFPTNYSCGKIHISCSDFSTYYILLTRWHGDLKGREEIEINQETDFELPGVVAWTVSFRRNDYAAITPETAQGLVTITFPDGKMWEIPSKQNQVSEIRRRVEYLETSIGSVGKLYVPSQFIGHQNYYHFAPAAFIKDGQGRSIVASQSADDIAIAARLGFRYIEANVQKTSDGVYLCLHGESGKWGSGVFSKDGTNISQNNISDTTFAYVEENIRFASVVEKYQTKVLTLEKFCELCKLYNLGVFAGAGERAAVEIVMEKMGDNCIIYNPPVGIRSYFNGYIFVWENSSSLTIQSMMSKADGYGVPYILGVGPNLLSALISGNNLDDLVTAFHEKGYLLAATGVYDTEEQVATAIKAGFDLNASGWAVDAFEANIQVYDIQGDTSQFSGTATISDGMATIAANQNLICGDDTTLPLGKGSLEIVFSGTLLVTFGSRPQRTIVSDGTLPVVISDYFFQNKDKLTIENGSNTTVSVTRLVYKVSRC